MLDIGPLQPGALEPVESNGTLHASCHNEIWYLNRCSRRPGPSSQMTVGVHLHVAFRLTCDDADSKAHRD